MPCFQSVSAVIISGVHVTLEVDVKTHAGFVPPTLSPIWDKNESIVLLLSHGLNSGGQPTTVRFEKVLKTKDDIKRVLVVCEGDGVAVSHKP